MAYQGYSDQPAAYGQSNPYGNPSPYGQAGNPYDDNNNSYGNRQDPYSAGQYDRQGYEMGNVNGSDPNRILNLCRQIDAETEQLDARQQRLAQMQDAFYNDTQTGEASRTQAPLEHESRNLMESYRELVRQTKNLKQDKESGNPRNSAQVGRVDRKVKSSITKLQQLDSTFQRRLKERSKREVQIVRPDASEAEVEQLIADPAAPIFAQTLMNSDRRGQAQSTLSAVKGRHEAIKKIEQDMMDLAAMFQDLDALVIQQEAAVTSIEQRGEEVTDHVAKANTELDGAVTKARAARKKKWICLGIAVLIVIIIVVVVVVAVLVTRNN